MSDNPPPRRSWEDKMNEEENKKVANMAPEDRKIYLEIRDSLGLGSVKRTSDAVHVGESGKSYINPEAHNTQASAPQMKSQAERLMVCLHVETGGTERSEKMERDNVIYIGAADGWEVEFLDQAKPGHFTRFVTDLLGDIEKGLRPPLIAIGVWIGAHGTNRPMHLFELPSGSLEMTETYLRAILAMNVPFSLGVVSSCHAGGADKIIDLERTGGMFFAASNDNLARGFVFEEETVEVDGVKQKICHTNMTFESSGFHMRYSVDDVDYEAALRDYDALGALWGKCNSVFSFQTASGFFRGFTKGMKLRVAALTRIQKQQLLQSGIYVWSNVYTDAGLVRTKYYAEPRPTEMYKTIEEVPIFQQAKVIRERELKSKPKPIATPASSKASRKHVRHIVEEDSLEAIPKKIRLQEGSYSTVEPSLRRGAKATTYGYNDDDHYRETEEIWPSKVSFAVGEGFRFVMPEELDKVLEQVGDLTVSTKATASHDPRANATADLEAGNTPHTLPSTASPSVPLSSTSFISSSTASATSVPSVTAPVTAPVTSTVTSPVISPVISPVDVSILSSATTTPANSSATSTVTSLSTKAPAAVFVQPLRTKTGRGRPRKSDPGTLLQPLYKLPDDIADFTRDHGARLIECQGAGAPCGILILRVKNIVDLDNFTQEDWLRIATKYNAGDVAKSGIATRCAACGQQAKITSRVTPIKKPANNVSEDS